LEYGIDGVPYKVNITQKETSVSIPLAAKPVNVVMDPDVNLLASFEMNTQ
jgi:hypothetical protein